jgi:hypothetical protein
VVAEDELGDVGWHAVGMASVAKILRKSWGLKMMGLPYVQGDPVNFKSLNLFWGNSVGITTATPQESVQNNMVFGGS